MKPKSDLITYCKIKGGKLRSINLNKHNLTDGKYLSSLQAYVNVITSNVTGLKSELQISSDIKIPIHISQLEMASHYAEIVETMNIRSGIYEARKSIDKAINEEAFGTFSCMKAQHSLWSVNIIPFKLIHRDGVQLGSPLYTLSIGIIPLVKSEK